MSQTNLLDQILSGQNRQLQLMAAQGMVPLPPEDLIPVQVGLTRSPDPEVSGTAAQAILDLEPRFAADFLTEHAGDTELAYFARHHTHPTVLGAILRRRDVPRHVLVSLAETLSPELQESLVLRQDAIIDEPEILVALEKNPALTNYAKRRIWEYREHLLPTDKVPPKTPAEIQAEADGATEEELAEAIEEVTGEGVQRKGGGEIDLENLTDAQVRALPVPLRLKVARGAPKQIRNILIRDKNSQVALAVINSNPIPDNEIEAIASNRAVCEEVLAEIAKHREWVRKYPIIKALVKNPKTYTSIAVGFVPRMAVRDLRELARDKNVSDAVRQLSLRLYNARKQ